MKLSTFIFSSVLFTSSIVGSSVYGMEIEEFEYTVVDDDKVWELKFSGELVDAEELVHIIDKDTGETINITIDKLDDVTYSIRSDDYVIGNSYEMVVSGDGLKKEYRKTFGVSDSLNALGGKEIGNERGLFMKRYDQGNGVVVDGVDMFGIVKSRYVDGRDEVVEGVTVGTASRSDVTSLLGVPVDSVEVRGSKYLFDDSGEYEVFNVENRFLFVFYDKHKNDNVRAVYWIDRNTYIENPSYLDGEIELRSYFEDSMVDLINSTRLQEGLGKLNYDVMMNEVARKHSENMVENDFFDHTDTEGFTVSDRVREGGYRVSLVGENLAYGQLNAMFAHENLMNSLGHRENILNKDYSDVGVGVAFSEENVPYFTIIFYR